ncbi:hypothetical protein M438DRAFT_146010 [Aureobasidium pullulans EXF-150]|uniref:Uncharacterized protein n=1 Tax=Aureobasidium pullulans EXF-150 TaxID=1043002 RepID=A0A074X297_AURPU|nr:uncharacterized protein M438DRAFT_146010 [Aureobasidium pullulans EXF-150]KEQ79533.1 hypothetical protein M438DRAFT_146010 [Aureobasidium pullulans EXF-150]
MTNLWRFNARGDPNHTTRVSPIDWLFLGKSFPSHLEFIWSLAALPPCRLSIPLLAPYIRISASLSLFVSAAQYLLPALCLLEHLDLRRCVRSSSGPTDILQATLGQCPRHHLSIHVSRE